jgi:D-aminopeptidase
MATTATPPPRVSTQVILDQAISSDEMRAALRELIEATIQRTADSFANRPVLSQIRFAAHGHANAEIVQFLVERVHGLSVRHATLLVEEATQGMASSATRRATQPDAG